MIPTVNELHDPIEGDSNRFHDDAFTWGQFLTFFTQKDVFCFVARGEEDAWCGHILFRHSTDEAEILTVYVKEEWRQQGLGHTLLETAIGRLKLLGVKEAFLDVRTSNLPARKLYENVGATYISTRPDYYAATATHPKEDAVVYKLML